MTPLDFTAYWRANPFRAFRVHAAGAVHEVTQPLQIAMSPNMQRVTLALDEGTVTLRVEEIERCEWIGGTSSAAAAPALADADEHAACDAGTPVYEIDEDAGRRLVHVSIEDRAGRTCFTTDGTLWDVHGIETFENGCSLYLHHLEHPTFEQRVIIWPGSNGTFETFAEALGFDPLYGELKKRDDALRSKPRDFAPEARYFKDIVPRPRYAHPGAAAGRDKDPLDDAERYVIKLVSSEVGPNQWGTAPLVRDTHTKEVLLDLWNTSWDLVALNGAAPGSMAEPPEEKDPDSPEAIIHASPPWTMELRHYPEGQRALTLEVDPKAGTGRLPGASAPLPLFFVDRCLRNFCLHERWEWLVHMLGSGPPPATEPLYRHTMPGGYLLEIWPGPAERPPPNLQIRVCEPAARGGAPGRVLLDTRGSDWAVDMQPSEDQPRLTLQFLSADAEDRQDAAAHRLAVDLPSRRVTCDTLEGSTALGVLHAVVQKARGGKWLCEELTEAFARGKSVPLP